jgi:hypothetical protein
MTHDELLAKIDFKIEYCTCEGWGNNCWEKENIPWRALCAVVELHKPYGEFIDGKPSFRCQANHEKYPCPTIQAIEKELE